MANNYSYHRGHKIEEITGIWFYVDTNEPVYMDKDRPCGKCGISNTKEGHDACLGTIPSKGPGHIMNACCGHGDTKTAYIQFNNGNTIRGEAVVKYINKEQHGT